MTCEQWLHHFTQDVAPRHQWTVNAKGEIRTVFPQLSWYRCCCPLTAETARAPFWWKEAATAAGLSAADATAIAEAADMGGPWPATGIRARLLAACGLQEDAYA